jgi:Rad3-related DNA helicase
MRIKSIKSVGVKKVFDMSVQDNHNFVASGIVVHNCTNYKIGKYLVENVKTNRFLTHDSTNRDEVLKLHINSQESTVLLSPSMMEGVDLKDDLSRFQIICKVPFPYLGDLVVKRRMELNNRWYPYSTAKSMIQSLGRSIRNETDHAISYILDSDWERFYRMNKELFPKEFNAVVN